MLSSCVRPSVRLSTTSRYCTKMATRLPEIMLVCRHSHAVILPTATADATSNQGLKWRVVRELLHSDKRKSYSSFEAGKLCSSFSLFLIDKLKCVTKVVGERSESMFYLTSTSHEPARQLYVNFGRYYYSRSHCSPIKVIAARRHVSLFTQAVS